MVWSRLRRFRINGGNEINDGRSRDGIDSSWIDIEALLFRT